MHRFTIAVVLYNPTQLELEHLRTYADEAGGLLIYDNSAQAHLKVIESLLPADSFEFFFHAENMGISYAYNEMAKFSREHGYSGMLCLDQDSSLSKKDLNILDSSVRDYMDNTVGIICARTKYSSFSETDIASNIVEKNFVITSGSILNLSVFDELNGFDEKIFIDGVDRDYCLTLRSRDEKILEVRNVLMRHKLGDGKKNLFGVYEHSALRNYYIFRNRFYVQRKHKSEFSIGSKVRSSFLATFRQIFSIIFCESNKLKKLAMICRATGDYKAGRFGKITMGSRR